MQAKAVHKNMRISPQKVRLVIDQIRNLSVSSASNILTFHKKKAAPLVLKVLKSVVANAVHNLKLEPSNLYISEAFVDSGLVMKRLSPRAQGKRHTILKRTSHVTIKVALRGRV